MPSTQTFVRRPSPRSSPNNGSMANMRSARANLPNPKEIMRDSVGIVDHPSRCRGMSLPPLSRRLAGSITRTTLPWRSDTSPNRKIGLSFPRESPIVKIMSERKVDPTQTEPTISEGERTFGWWDMFVDPDDDPRSDGGFVGERATLLGYLRDQRLTLEMQCSGLDAAELARRSVRPSNLSLLG